MISRKQIFALVTLRLVEEEIHGSSIASLQGRTVGVFEKKEDACETLLHNYGALDENSYYKLAVIEPLTFGLYPILNHDESEFWEWDRENEKWVPLPPVPEGKSNMNYSFATPDRWGSQEYSLSTFSQYASIG